MNRYLSLFLIFCLWTLHARGQWSKTDSLQLDRLLQSNEELKLNKKVIRQIDFGSFLGTPEIVDEKPALDWNVTLPVKRTERERGYIPLKAYTANTPFNYDPVLKKKIKVGPNTWKRVRVYNKRYDINNMISAVEKTNKYEIKLDDKYIPVSFVKGVQVYTHINGGGIGGLDFNAIFTREFWDKSIGERRRRTLEVLKQYGDSTTVNINKSVIVLDKK